MFESAYCFVYYNTFSCRMHKRVIDLITLLAHFLDYLILIVTIAFFPLPSVAIAVIFTDFFLPAFSALTFPDPDTVAYFVLLLVHFSFLLAPLDAVTLAFRLSVFHALTVFFPVILIFLTVPFMILILNVAFFPLPSVAYAVIVTVFPAAFLLNFTTPFLSTVAYFLLLVVHLIFLLLALLEILAVNFTFFPAESLFDGALGNFLWCSCCWLCWGWFWCFWFWILRLCWLRRCDHWWIHNRSLCNFYWNL